MIIEEDIVNLDDQEVEVFKVVLECDLVVKVKMPR